MAGATDKWRCNQKFSFFPLFQRSLSSLFQHTKYQVRPTKPWYLRSQQRGLKRKIWYNKTWYIKRNIFHPKNLKNQPIRLEKMSAFTIKHSFNYNILTRNGHVSYNSNSRWYSNGILAKMISLLSTSDKVDEINS